MKNCNSKFTRHSIKLLPLIFGLLALSFSCQNSQNKPIAPYLTPLSVGDKKIFVDIADTEGKKQLGLSGREPLTDSQGMIFIFEPSTTPGFWMKDMQFDLDLIWIRNKKIIGITADVPSPASISNNLTLYYPPSEVDTVLEVNAGWSEKYKVVAGDEIIIMKN